MDGELNLAGKVVSRRRFLLGTAGAIVSVVLQACRARPAQQPAPDPPQASAPPSGEAPRALAPTPACSDGDEPTEPQTEGPFFRTRSPMKTNFRADVSEGTPLVLSGAVLSTACLPVSRAKMELWHADNDGGYDNAGFRLRGHFFTDDQGRYRVETIVPGLYAGRTRHYHVKVQPEGGRVLTTQLYFPDEPANERDGIFDSSLVMRVNDVASGKEASFDFVVQV